MEREAHGAEPRRDDHPGVGEPGGHLRPLAAREACDHDPGAAIVLGRGEDLGAEPLEPFAQLSCKCEVVLERVLDPEVEQVVDAAVSAAPAAYEGVEYSSRLAAFASGIVRASNAIASSVDFQPTNSGSIRSQNSRRR